jgi:hypothetical protein
MRETKRESQKARSGYRITRPRGIRGWPAYEDRDRMRAIKRWGIPQDVDAERERTSISRMPLNLNIQLSLSLAQHFLFETLFTHSLANVHLWRNIANLFLSVQCSIVRIFLFLFTNLIIYNLPDSQAHRELRPWHVWSDFDSPSFSAVSVGATVRTAIEKKIVSCSWKFA